MRRTLVCFGVGGLIVLGSLVAVVRADQSPAPANEKGNTVDELLDKLEALKGKKEAIEKQEQATIALLKEKLAKQATTPEGHKKRLAKLGIVDEAAELAARKKAEAAYEAAMKKAKGAMEAKKYAEAIRAYTDALRNKPKDPDALEGDEKAARLFVEEAEQGKKKTDEARKAHSPSPQSLGL
jgi:hypothetical protein